MTENAVEALRQRLVGLPWLESAWVRGQAVGLCDEVERLRQELKDYGDHYPGCYCRYTESELRGVDWTDAMQAARVCSCGLAEAIEG